MFALLTFIIGLALGASLRVVDDLVEAFSAFVSRKLGK